MVKTKTWIALIAALLLVCGFLAFLLPRGKAGGHIANVYVDGVCIRSIDLDAVTEGYSFPVFGVGGDNLVAVEPGRICVLEADCPDRICVKAGWLSESASPIVCLPHHLVIRLEKSTRASDEIDAVSK